MSSQELIRRIQRAYPLIWYHCHTQHTGRGDELSDRESNVLGHLQAHAPTTPAQLASHLGIAASTLSEAIEKLAQRGLVRREPDVRDRRRVTYRLNAEGAKALDSSSVLSAARLGEALGRLDPVDRDKAVTGLELIASACKPLECPAP